MNKTKREALRVVNFAAHWEVELLDPPSFENSVEGRKFKDYLDNWLLDADFEGSFTFLRRCLESRASSFGEWIGSARPLDGRAISKF